MAISDKILSWQKVTVPFFNLCPYRCSYASFISRQINLIARLQTVMACTFFGAGGMLAHDQLTAFGLLQNSVLIVTKVFGLHSDAYWRR
jgi:hypothetical protein